jgi:hypothetical protein
MKHQLIGMVVVIGTLAGCAQDDYLRTEGLTLTAGDSVARNTALQVIDPWPARVEDTDIAVPADRGGDLASSPVKPVSPASTANP